MIIWAVKHFVGNSKNVQKQRHSSAIKINSLLTLRLDWVSVFAFRSWISFNRLLRFVINAKKFAQLKIKLSVTSKSWQSSQIFPFLCRFSSWTMSHDHAHHHMHDHHEPMVNLTTSTAMPSVHDHHDHSMHSMSGDSANQMGHAVHHMMEMAVSLMIDIGKISWNRIGSWKIPLNQLNFSFQVRKIDSFSSFCAHFSFTVDVTKLFYSHNGQRALAVD